VVFTLGRFQSVKGPGLVLLIPFFQEMVRVDLRIQVIEIPTQDVISHDNVSMKVDAVLYFNVVDPERAIIQVQSYLPATNMLAQTTLRAVLGQHELDEMLSERKKLSTDVQSILDTQTETWGIKVSNVEIRTVELTENMVRAIAKQAEAERDRRAKIIHAEAEFQASGLWHQPSTVCASSGGGRVQIVLKTAPDSFSIRVSDQGNGPCPYPDTQTSGDGARMVAAFARQIDAAVTKRRNPAGYAVTVTVPRRSDRALDRT
jgi:regulator of protease activity HflC (stomatin/prohibitin superfamily)